MHDNATTAAVEARGLSVGYRRQVVVHEACIGLARGRITALIGPNGSGKSTFLKGVFGAARIFAGDVYVDGQRVDKVAPRELIRSGVAYVPQVDNVFPKLTVRENLEMGRLDRRRSLADIFELFPPLAERPGTRAGRLSGGQRGMLAVARALASDPRVLLLDEVTAGLSPVAASNLLGHLDGLVSGGLTIGLVEQNVEMALNHASYVYMLRGGRCALEGDVAMWRGFTTDELTELFLGGDNDANESIVVGAREV